MSAEPKDIARGRERKARPPAAAGATPDAKRRFSDRVEAYVQYRPTYPPTVLMHLRDAVELTPEWVVADVGSGTGISSQLFLDHGNVVYGVEPNADMRAAAERLLAAYPRFRSVDGSAEGTTLPDRAVDLVAAGQAFHWFDPAAARREFARVLKPGRPVVLMWNTRRLGGSPFLEAYEQLLLRFGTDYQQVRHEGVTDDKLRAFYGPAGFRLAAFPNQQAFDFAGLRGRLNSASYAPARGRPGYDAMIEQLRRTFDQFNVGGRVVIEYDTQVYTGVLG